MKQPNLNTNVGIIKELDPLGRILIPKDYRERLMLEKEVELILTNEGLLLRNPEYRLIKNRADIYREQIECGGTLLKYPHE